MVQGAITDVLKSEMKSYGVAPNLEGLIATLTRPLKPPDATTDGEVSRSRWMLGVRNVFWSTSPDKSAEVHSDGSGNLLLVLRSGAESIRLCYVEEGGGVAEYVLRNEE